MKSKEYKTQSYKTSNYKAASKRNKSLKVFYICVGVALIFLNYFFTSMETMTTARARRTYITDVHKSLAKKIGEDGADTLTHYLEEVIPAQIEDKVQFLATKEDVAKVEAQVANVRADLKEDIANVKAEVAKVEVKVAQLETQITQVRGELKEDIAKVETKLTGLILNSQLKME